MARKFKMTGFARFFIVMLFVAPLAYIGASYLNKEDGIKNFKNLIGLDEKTEKMVDEIQPAEQSDAIKPEDEAISGDSSLTEKIEKLEAEIQDLREIVKAKDLEIKYLKQQLDQQQ